MTDNNKSGSDDWGSRQKRKTVEKLKGAGVAIVIIVLYNLLDPKHILLEYLSVLLDKVSVLWSQFVLLTQRNWLIYLIGLFSAWIVIALLQKFFAVMSLPKEGGQNPNYGVESGFWEKWEGRISGNLDAIFAGIKSFIAAVIIIYVIFVFILLNSIGKLISNIKQNPAILIGLCGVGLIALGVLILVIRRTNTKYDALYDEIQSALRTILIPLGFKEKKSKSNMHHPTVPFSRGKLSVVLWWNYREQYYCVDGSSKESMEERQARINDLTARATILEDDKFRDAMEELENEQNDFSVEGDITDPRFKTKVIAELNKWLFNQGVR